MATMKYSELIAELKAEMGSGRRAPGSRLPSIRILSEQYGCSKNTVIRAYDELEREHLIYAVPKSGYFVVGGLPQGQKGSGREEEDVFDFVSASPSADTMPYKEYQICLNQAIDQYKAELFAYTHRQGLPSLRRQISKHLQKLQVFADPDSLFVVSGSQQALFLLAGMSFPNGKSNILLEQPTYFGMLDSAELHQVTTLGIERDANGIDFDKLESAFRNNGIKFFYTVPRFHNPLGYSYSNDDKKKIVKLAQQYDVYIVEDDYLGDLETDGKYDPLYAYDTSDRVIYLKSFSKSLLPGMRLGVAVVPKLMQGTFLRHKACADLTSGALSQGALEIYLSSGLFDVHAERMKKLYRSKMRKALAACGMFMPQGVTYTTPETGFFITVELPREIKAERVVQLLKQDGIGVANANRMFLPEYRREHMLRLCLASVEEERIAPGIERIARRIAECMEIRTRGALVPELFPIV